MVIRICQHWKMRHELLLFCLASILILVMHFELAFGMSIADMLKLPKCVNDCGVSVHILLLI